MFEFASISETVRHYAERVGGSLRHDRAIHLAGLELGVVAVLGASLAMAAPSPDRPAPAPRLTESEINGQAFARLTASMDPAMLSLALRFEPQMTAGALGGPLQQVSDVGDDPSVIRIQDLAPDAARIWNRLNPVVAASNTAAKPFKLNASGVLDEARALDCMTAAVYYEAASESGEGQRAVAQVVLNRMRHPAYPKTVCGVVFQGSTRRTGCQFSFTCDGSLARRPSEAGWARARKVAAAALDGYVMKAVGNATHYHADYVAPYWSPSLLKIGAIGAHIFYRWTGTWGMPPAFSGRYAGGEMNGLQIATLDGLNKSGGRLETTPVNEIHAPVTPENFVEAAVSPRGGEGSDTTETAQAITATSAGVDAIELTKPEDLDWAGRPKARGPSRLAMPAGGGF